MNWKETLAKLAPTVAVALGGPLAGAAVSAISAIFGIDDGKQADIQKIIENGQLTPEQIAELRKLELQYTENEKERGFRYAELAFKDRDSARSANVSGGIQGQIFIMSITLLLATLGTEIYILFNGYPTGLPDIVVGRILGLMDSVALMVLAYHYGTSSGSQQKNDLLIPNNKV